jgi:hypothetical protein
MYILPDNYADWTSLYNYLCKGVKFSRQSIVLEFGQQTIPLDYIKARVVDELLSSKREQMISLIASRERQVDYQKDYRKKTQISTKLEAYLLQRKKYIGTARQVKKNIEI